MSAAAAPTTVDWSPRDKTYDGLVQLHVDASDVQRGIFRVSEILPVSAAGPLTLLFPKWVPGNHAPTAPIQNLAGLRISVNAKPLPWRRDAVDMHAFHVEVPDGAKALDITFDYLSATDASQGRVVATPQMLNLQWFSLALYPAGHFARRISVSPSVTLPKGWQFASQLAVAQQQGETVKFRSNSLEALIDSPIFAGRNSRKIDLGSAGGAPVALNVFADRPEQLAATEATLLAHRKLVTQSHRLFGRPPFPRYDFLLAISDQLGGIGTEHLASSENSGPPEYFTDPEAYIFRALLPHELVHSWNGKARRPADLWTPDFNRPMQASMLWMYEGQTHFWGWVLSARSGLVPRQQVLDTIARYVARQSVRPGRDWRPLVDTAYDSIISADASLPYPSWRRTVTDTYEEGNLVWMEADGIIREGSRGTRSLDHFANAFFQGGGEAASLYNFADVVTALNDVYPYDWGGFLRRRFSQSGQQVATDWLQRSGYRLAFSDVPTPAFAAFERRDQVVDLRFSLGIALAAGAGGKITEVIWDGPAFRAGIATGSTIQTVNGKPYSTEALRAAVLRNRTGAAPIALSLDDRGEQSTVVIDYRGGMRYPRLERVATIPDRLGELLNPLDQPVAAGRERAPSIGASN